MSDKARKTSEVFQTSEVSTDSILQQALADQRERCRRGESFQVESYLERHPPLRDHPEAMLDLIYQEMVLRESRGETPALVDYVARFPALAADLQIQFEIEQAIEPDEDQATLTVERDRLLGEDEPRAPPVPRPAPGMDFELLDGAGGAPMTSGADYKARQRSLNRIVTLKLLSAVALPRDEVARLRIGIESISRLQHPSIAQVYEMGIVDGKLCLVGEHLAGGSLAHRLDGAPWPPAQAARLIETLARALHYAHQQGVVHGDLTLHHIVMASGVPKITGLGLARMLGKGDAGDPQRDVRALGAMLRELLTGASESGGATAMARELETICRTCQQEDPHRRYATALLLAEDLRRFQIGQPIRAHPLGWGERLLHGARRHPVVVAALALICLAAVILVAANW